MHKRNTPFKSPFQAGRSGTGHPSRQKTSNEDLKLKLEQVNKEIESLKSRGYKEEELQTHIQKMHEYNEIKDIGQIVLGQLATVRGVCTKDLYAEYGLELDD